MKINYEDIYVGNIMVADSYSYDDSFGDSKNTRNTGHIDNDGAYEVMIYLGTTYGGAMYAPIKWVKGEHNFSLLKLAVHKFVKDEKAALKEKHKEQILRTVVYSVGDKYVSNIKPVFPNKKGSMFLREAKNLREEIKKQAYIRGKITGKSIEKSHSEEIEEKN